MHPGIDGAQFVEAQLEAALGGQPRQREVLGGCEPEGLGDGDRAVHERVAVADEGDRDAFAGQALDGERAFESGRAASGDEQVHARKLRAASGPPSGPWTVSIAGFPQSQPAVAPDAAGGSATEASFMPTNVLIAGGGPAALEAALALHRLAGDQVATTMLAPESNLTYRPLSVLAPFAAGGATDLPARADGARRDFTHVRGRLATRGPRRPHRDHGDGERLPYDILLVASGARPVETIPRALTFSGSLTDQERLHGLVQDVEGGFVRRVAFVVPAGSSWSLPLYELALMLAERAYSMWVDLELHFVTPEATPLALFGPEASREVAGLMTEAKIALHTASSRRARSPGRLRLTPGGRALEVSRIVTLPRLQGPAIPGLPADPQGFLMTDAHARVQGVADVYAAGDITAFPVKQGGIACQQADAAAAHIAAQAGAPVQPVPFAPVLRGMLLTERSAHFMRREARGAGDVSQVAGRALWWPPTKIAGRELAGYLEGLDDAAGRPSGRPVNLAVGDSGTGEIEVLSLH